MRRALALCLVPWALSPLIVKAATVSTAGATFKVRRDQPPLASRAVAISAARNEFEPFQVLVTGPATGVRATTTALAGPGGASVGPVRLYREDLIRIGTPSAPDAIVGAGAWLPDALVPDVDEVAGERRNAFTRFDVAAGETRAIWGEVRVPASAPAGLYTGSVTIRFAEGSATVPVTLTVWDFTLPARASLKSAFGLSYPTLPAGHRVSTSGSAFPALRARYDQLALDHRVSLSTHDDGDGSIAHFDALYGPYVSGSAATLSPGAALTSVQYGGGLADVAGMRAWYDHAAGQGWADRLLQYTCDEPPMTCAWTDIPGRLRAAKAANSAFRTLLTTTLGEVRDAETRYGISIERDLELVVPVINALYDKPGQRFAGPQAQGYAAFVRSGPRKELWSYQSCMSHGCGGTSSYYTGWPSYMIDASAVRNRAMQWLEFLYGVTGEVYYETTMAYSHDPWSNQWDFSGNGDGTLFYPGTPARIGGTTDVPVASVRLKLIREGMEDYEYLKLLSDLGDPAMARGEAQALFPTAYQTEQSPDALMAARERIARRIVQLRGGAPALAWSAPLTPAVAFTADAAELGGDPIALSGAAAGSDGSAQVRVSWDDDFLYATWDVRDAALVVNQGGRDGEVWNGDSVELMIDTSSAHPASLGPSHHHLLVNVNGDLADERGAAGAWDRSWSSGATTAVTRTAAGYAVELKVPWTSLGVAPCPGLTLGLDVAVNDVDAPGASPRPFDWAQLTRFARPAGWGTLTLSGTVGADTVLVRRAPGPVVVDGNLAEFAGAPAVSLVAAAAAVGSGDRATVQLLWDDAHLYAGFRVEDAALRLTQGGRDGEVWNGDGVEVLLDPRSTRTAAPDGDDRHVLVNAAGDLTDEAGASGGWSRAWSSNAQVAVAGIPGAYTIELAIPWSAIGVAAPAPGAVMGIDLATNDLDAAGVLHQFDWARLARFAQPARWRRALLDGRAPGCGR